MIFPTPSPTVSSLNPLGAEVLVFCGRRAGVCRTVAGLEIGKVFLCLPRAGRA